MDRWTDAVDTWKVLVADETCDDGVRAAAVYNISLVQCLRGEYVSAIADIETLATLAPGYKSGFYAYVLRVLSRAEHGDRRTAADALFRHVYSTPHSDASVLAQSLGRALGSLAEQQVPPPLVAVQAVGDIIRSRQTEAPPQDLLLVKRVMQWLEQRLVALSSRLSLDGTHLPPAAWRHVTSNTRWALYHFGLEDHLGLGGAERLQALLSDTLLSEYERHVLTPLRMTHRSSGLGSWPFIASPSAPAVRESKTTIAASPRLVVKHPDEDDPSNYDWVFTPADLYTGRFEWSLIEMLLRKNPRPFAAQLRQDLKDMRKSQPDLVAVVIGPVDVKDGFWNGTYDDRLAETRRLRSGVKLMKAIRDADAHNLIGNLANGCEQAKEAWAYILSTILLSRGVLTLGDLGSTTPWHYGTQDVRRHWAARCS
ncbi:MAG TPA: hypothetical protein VJM31_04325 [Vicinamibacterales bacterium]|nr:hypothetical protein [Vicinamibacterales bacterium]